MTNRNRRKPKSKTEVGTADVLKSVRKEVPRPTVAFRNRKAYNRRKVKEQIREEGD